MAIYERVTARLSRDSEPITTLSIEGRTLLKELCDLAETRVALRVGMEYVPGVLEPIAADVAVKLFRRVMFEGIASEGADKISTSFVENVLDEYADDLDAYVKARDREAGASRVRFI